MNRLRLPILATVFLFPATATAQAVEREMRLYNLDGLTMGPGLDEARIPPAPRLRGSLEGWEEGDSTEEHEGAGATGMDPALLQELIAQFIDPDSWENERNKMEMTSGNQLAVIQRPQVQESIRRFLGRLEGELLRKVQLEISLVPPDVLGDLAPGWRRPGSSPWLGEDLLEQAALAAGDRGWTFSRSLRDGSRVILGPASISRRLIDHEVNQTGVLPVTNPEIQNIEEGFFADVRILLDPTGTRFRADLVVGQIAAPEESIVKRRLPWGDIELLRQRQERIETSVVAPLGMTAVLAAFSLPSGAPEKGKEGEGPSPLVFLLRVKKLFPEIEPREVGPEILRCAFLTEPIFIRHWFSSERTDFDFTRGAEEAGEKILIESDFLRETIDSIVNQDRNGKVFFPGPMGMIFLQGGVETVKSTRHWILSLASKKALPVAVNIWQGSAPRSDLESAGRSGIILPDGWLEKIEKADGVRVRISGMDGVPSALYAVDSRHYIRNLEKVSGGTDREVLEVTDPTVGIAGEGIVIKTLVDLIPGTPWAQLRIQGERARKPDLTRKTRIRENLRVEPARDEKGRSKIRATGEWVEIDLPEESSESWQHLVTAPLGKPILLNALPDGGGDGKDLVLVAVVSAQPVEAPLRGKELKSKK